MEATRWLDVHRQAQEEARRRTALVKIMQTHTLANINMANLQDTIPATLAATSSSGSINAPNASTTSRATGRDISRQLF